MALSCWCFQKSLIRCDAGQWDVVVAHVADVVALLTKRSHQACGHLLMAAALALQCVLKLSLC